MTESAPITWDSWAAAHRNEIRAALAPLYDQPGRHYHNGEHLRECFEEFAAARVLCASPGAVELAILAHDCVYDARRSDNEQRSSDAAGEILVKLGAPTGLVARVSELVLATRHVEPPGDEDARILVDIDLSILGKPPERFDRYERDVRLEYPHVDDAAFRAGRAAVLRHFLDRPSIYWTDHFRRRYETNARANLEPSLELLKH